MENDKPAAVSVGASPDLKIGTAQPNPDPAQQPWILNCSNCGGEYSASSSNWDQIRCPKCGGV